MPHTKNLWLLPLLIMTFLLGSCASTSKAPESKSSEAKTFNTTTDAGTVYLYRTGRAVGAAGQLTVKINSLDAGGTGPGIFSLGLIGGMVVGSIMGRSKDAEAKTTGKML